MGEEIWKDVKNYEGLYQVSNLGRVKSLDYKHTGKEQILKPRLNNRGYLQVNIYKDKKRKNSTVHRLVAQAFLANPNNYPEVNHKTENPLRNFVYINEDGTVDLEKSELEWCTHKSNINFGSHNKRVAAAQKGKEPWNKGKTNIYSEDAKMKMSAAKKGKFNTKHSKPVLQLDKITEEIIAEFPSAKEAERKFGFESKNISQCCTGKRKSCGGFRWRFK